MELIARKATLMGISIARSTEREHPITPYGGAAPKNRDGIHTKWRNSDHLKDR
jgi:hypothetical protein